MDHITQKIMNDNAALSKRLAALEAVALTKQAGLPESEGATIQKALQGDRAAVEKLLGHIRSATAMAKAGGIFKEFGSGHGVVTTAYDELVSKAKELRKSDPRLNFPQAFAKVYGNPENADLVRRERGENRPAWRDC